MFFYKKEPTNNAIIFKYSTINQLINNNQLIAGSIVKILKIFYFFPVFIPKTVYNGQKLIKLVSRNTPASTNNTVPRVPLIVPV